MLINLDTVYVCQTYNDKHDREIVCIKPSLASGKEWLHNRTKMIAKATRLKSKYYLAKPRSKEASKLYSKYYKFRELHKLYHEEQTCYPFIWSFDIE